MGVVMLLTLTGLIVIGPNAANAATACNSYSWLYIPRVGDYILVPSIGYDTDNVHCVLSVGSENAGVIIMQSALNRSYNTGLVVDGDFGNRTRAAVLYTQKVEDISQDGVYGPQTCSHIRWPFINTPNAWSTYDC